MSEKANPGWPEKTIWPRFQKRRHVSLWTRTTPELEECQVCAKPSSRDPENFFLYAGGEHGLKVIQKDHEIRGRDGVVGFVCPHCSARNLYSEGVE